MCNPNTVLDHQRGESWPIDQNDVIRHLIGEISSLTCKVRRRNEDALSCTPASKSSVKCLHIRSTDRTVPTFCLDVDPLKPEFVKRDNSIDSPVPGVTHPLKVLLARAVTQCVQEFENKLLEESWRCPGNFLKKFSSNLLMDLLDCTVNSFVWRLLSRRHQGLRRGILVPTGSWPDVAGLLDNLSPDFLSEPLWMKRKKLSATLGYPPHTPCGRIQIARTFEHAETPTAAVSVPEVVRQIRKPFGTLSLGKLQQVGHSFVDLFSHVAIRLRREVAKNGMEKRPLGRKRRR